MYCPLSVFVILTQYIFYFLFKLRSVGVAQRRMEFRKYRNKKYFIDILYLRSRLIRLDLFHAMMIIFTLENF